MIPADRIQHWAVLLAPSDLGAGVLVGGALVGLLCGLIRSRSALLPALPTLGYLLVATYTLCHDAGLSFPWRAGLALATLVTLVGHIRYAGRDELESAGAGVLEAIPPAGGAAEYVASIEDPFRPVATSSDRHSERVDVTTPRSRGVVFALVLGFVLTGVLLVDELGTYAGTLLAWESPVVSQGFVPAIDKVTPFWEFVGQRFLWDDGVLSAGHTSLFYGPTTLALMRYLEATPWTLRVSSVLATILAMGVLFTFARRYFGRDVALGATLFFGLNSPVLLYGRYGSSIAGTLLAVWLAFLATWFFLERGRLVWLRAVGCGAVLYLTTLQYAPGRLAVLFLLGLIPFALLTDREPPRRAHWFGVVVVAVMALGVWTFESANEREHYFLHGRGEQVFGLIRHPQTIPPLVGTTRRFSVETMDRAAKLEVLRLVVDKTFHELIGFLSPNPRPRSRGAVVTYDPPPMTLYFAPMGVLALLGLAHSIAGWRSWSRLALVLFPVAYCSALLLTNRIDAHRGVMLVIPFSLWVGMGVRDLGAVARRLHVPRAFVAIAGVSLIVAAAYSDIVIRYKARASPGRVAEALAEEIDSIPGTTSFWLARDHRELSWLGLRQADARKPGADGIGGVLPQGITNGLRSDKGGPQRLAVRQAARYAKVGTLLLGPRAMFRDAALALQKMQLRVSERNAGGFVFYRIDGGEKLTGVTDSTLDPLPPMQPPPTPVPVVLSQGVRVYLSDLPATKTEFGFAAPRMDQTWQGGRVSMRGVEYEKAIGTHAWTTMTFAVPKGALLFQAVVGLSDDIRGCESASVEFSVRDSRGATLWESAVIDFAAYPVAVEVPVGNQRQITLAVTEAGDGRDCDHANWGRPAFLMAGANAKR